MEQKIPDRRGISGSTLKIIAMVAMLIDHIGAALLVRWMKTGAGMVFLPGVSMTIMDHPIYPIYRVFRWIGRIAFPIFIFLMVEGLHYTGNRWKYVARMFAFAVLSEIPFDLAFNGRWCDFFYQNIFFTLLIGLLACIGLDAICKKCTGVAKFFCMLAVIGLSAGLAEVIHTDYGAMGIVCIVVIFLCRGNRKEQMLLGCTVFAYEITAPLAFVPIYFYNGKRGLKLKYFFYAFYPLHLFVIWLVAVKMGLGDMKVV